MNRIKTIKTEKDYKEALALVETLIGHAPDAESDEGEQLNLLSTLIEDYESKVFPKTLPNPIAAIKFRMEQSDLKPADLIPYIGSRSRVSEILSGKRQLTLEMVRALEAGLGIPAKVLIKKPEPEVEIEGGTESQFQHWNLRLVREMESYGYFGNASLNKRDKVSLLKNFFSSISTAQIVGMPRKSHYRSAPSTDKHALYAWSVRVIEKAKKVQTPTKYKHGIIDLDFMQRLAKLSVKDNSPVLAKEYLRKYGITLIIEPHLSKTYLDGATILINKDNPVIGLTLRYDRLDNFWFTLMHELGHIARHYNDDISLFFDEKLDDAKGVELDSKEKEADDLAREALVPSSKWENSPAKLIPSPIAAQSLANELGVHVAIIAGVMRHEHKNHYYLKDIVGDAKVRKCFEEIKWNK